MDLKPKGGGSFWQNVDLCTIYPMKPLQRLWLKGGDQTPPPPATGMGFHIF